MTNDHLSSTQEELSELRRKEITLAETRVINSSEDTEQTLTEAEIFKNKLIEAENYIIYIEKEKEDLNVEVEASYRSVQRLNEDVLRLEAELAIAKRESSQHSNIEIVTLTNKIN
jgi:hypothetical protein